MCRDFDAVLQPIWMTKNETADRVRGRIERVLDWAAAAGHREGRKSGALARQSPATALCSRQGAEGRRSARGSLG
ncbi:phage integrase central domain-containing protein [Cereibacter ovatus]|uniref:phage integrase central domain-containing protein n=1 Tax=Cereibacter ovatus TaxID=439529 RepID=UPI0038B29A45